MKRSHYTAVFLVIVMFVWLIIPKSIFAQQLRKSGRFYIADIEKEFKVKKGGDLKMEDIRGDVHISTWNKNLVKIKEIRKMDVYTEAEAKAVLKDLKSLYRQHGNTISVGMEGKYRPYMSSQFEIFVPIVFNVSVSTKGGDISVEDLKGKVELATSGGDIELYRIDGEIVAKTSGGDIIVKETGSDVDVKTSGGDIEILDVKGKVNAETSGGDIEIRNNQSAVVAKTSGGTIKLSQVGADVKAHTSGGDIIVNGSKGKLKLSTSGGDIELRDIQDIVNARTSGGDIEANTVLNGIVAKTSGGDIELQNVKGFIEAATSGGDIEAKMTLTDFAKDHHISLKSSGGDIVLYIPNKLPATIDATIKLTGISWEDYTISSDFPITIKKETKDNGRRKYKILHGKGNINGGGDLIELITSNGNIKIQKLK